MPYFERANQIYDKTIPQVTRNMEMNCNNLRA